MSLERRRDTVIEIMRNGGTVNLERLASGLKEYLNEPHELEDICKTVINVAEEMNYCGAIMNAADRIEEFGELGWVNFDRLIARQENENDGDDD